MCSRWTSSCDPKIVFKMMFTDHLEPVLSNFEQIFSGAEGENFGFLSKIFSMTGDVSRRNARSWAHMRPRSFNIANDAGGGRAVRGNTWYR